LLNLLFIFKVLTPSTIMDSSIVYLYMVYENYRRYKDYNKFYEISLTDNQVLIKEKYMDKDDYKMEFYEVPREYAGKVFKYVQDRFIKSNFPINVRSGELQSACIDFIKKCNNIKQEKVATGLEEVTVAKKASLLTLLPPPLLLPSSKLIALIANKATGELTVVHSVDTNSPPEFLQQISQYPSLQVLQCTSLALTEVDHIISAFHKDFYHLKSTSGDMELPWYRVSEVEVLQWLEQGRGLPITPALSSSPISPSEDISDGDTFLFDIDDLILSGTTTTTTTTTNHPFIQNKKRKKELLNAP
jgi:hypothetical protein